MRALDEEEESCSGATSFYGGAEDERWPLIEDRCTAGCEKGATSTGSGRPGGQEQRSSGRMQMQMLPGRQTQMRGQLCV